MKKRSLIIVLAAIFAMVMFQQCKKDDDTVTPEEKETVLPKNFKVDIPSALSNNNSSTKRIKEGGLNGNDIYEPLTMFIHVGESAAEIVEDIMMSIAVHGINQPMSISFVSDDDNRTKNLVVIEDAEFEGAVWEFQMTITDAGSETNNDGGKAIQVFWNRNPIDGIAILKPYNINRNESTNAPDAIYRIDYSEVGQNGYEKHMIVQLDELPMEDPTVDPYSISELKMFAGRNGTIIDVFGNSNHPNAYFFEEETVGFNWAFVASGEELQDIGVAEVGLPPSNLDATSREILLGDYSIKSVFEDQIYTLWPNIDSTTVNEYLANTEAPGYFDSNGFIQGGTAPGQGYDEIEAIITELVPYNPKDIMNLTINFKE